MSTEQVLSWIREYAPMVVGALLILIAGMWIAKRIGNWVQHGLSKTRMEPTAVSFLGTLARGITIMVAVLAALGTLGVETTSIIAVLGAAGLAIGLALKDSLSHLASGILLAVMRPFKIGDAVEVGGMVGSVDRIGLFHTELQTFDNRHIRIPNGNVMASSIINYSAYDTRRAEWVFGIAYGSNLKQAKQIIADILAADDQILAEPEPVIGLDNLNDSSVDFLVRAWVPRAELFPTQWRIREQVKLAFDDAGIEIPFPQRDFNIRGQLPTQ